MRTTALALLLLALLQVAFWKVQLFDAPERLDVDWGVVDLYVEHVPIVAYAAERVRAGELPLWNPHSLAGLPFLAVPHTAVLYPPNVVYLLWDAVTATDVSLVLHAILAALGVFLFARAVGASALAASAAALTFVWSGRLVALTVVPAWYAGLAWLPWVVLAAERRLQGVRAATPALAVAVALSVLAGSLEAASFALYAAGLYAVVRLAALSMHVPWREWWRAAAALLGAVAAGLCLAAPQLLPTAELLAASTRTAGELDWRAASVGAVAPDVLWKSVLVSHGESAVGLLPLLGLGLGIARGKLRVVWLYALLLALASAALVTGGSLYEAFFASPLGALVRRPQKFLALLAFAQAILAAVAVTRLLALAACARTALWRRPEWCAASLAIVGAWWALAQVRPDLRVELGSWIAVASAILVAYALAPGARTRAFLVGALVLLQGTHLFASAAPAFARPSRQPEVYEGQAELWEALHNAAGGQRIHVSSAFQLLPEMTPKQALLRGVSLANGYEALPLRRQARFFDRAARNGLRDRDFVGVFELGPGSRFWRLDLAAVGVYVTRVGRPIDVFLRDQSQRESGAEFSSIALPSSAQRAGIRAYRRHPALPRAQFAARARVVPGEREALRALDAQRPLPLRGVVALERPAAAPHPPPTDPRAEGSARIVSDAPERVEIEVEASGAGYLVLADAWSAGWRAYARGEELPVYRANHLFRAVAVGPGTTRVHFEYWPRSLTNGLLLAAASAIALLGTRRARPRSG